MMDLNGNGVDDLTEVVDGIGSFIKDEVSLLTSAATNAFVWLQGEMRGVPTAVQNFVTAAISKAQAKGGSQGEILANTMDILYSDAHALEMGVAAEVVAAAKAIKSEVLAGFVSLVTVVRGAI